MPTNEMVRRLIHLRERVNEMAAFKKEDHRRADTFGWHRPGQDDVPSRGTRRCRQGAFAEEVRPEAFSRTRTPQAKAMMSGLSQLSLLSHS